MVTIGRTYNIQGELYEIVRILKTDPTKIFDKEATDALKAFYKAEKLFRQSDGSYWLVNEIKAIPFDEVDEELLSGTNSEPRGDSNQNELEGSNSNDSEGFKRENEVQQEETTTTSSTQ